jgi:hypothetical protein
VKGVAFDHKIVVGAKGYDDPWMGAVKEYYVDVPSQATGSVEVQNLWTISLKHISLHDFQEKRYTMVVTGPKTVLITMPIANRAECDGYLMCLKASSLVPLKAVRNRYASKTVKNEHRILVEFNEDLIENSFPLSKRNKNMVEPNLVGSALYLKKMVKVQVDTPMPDVSTSAATVARSNLSTTDEEAPGAECEEEDILADRVYWVTWSVGIKGTRDYKDYCGSEDDDETEKITQKTVAMCASMFVEDVTKHGKKAGRSSTRSSSTRN